ncbi:MAG TPA: hypothetical protein VKB90_08430, partial [Candidatus Acidoferrum sp.]|nr:hypothetical protein [Candidatus Acidoferrum sp.]
MQILATMVGSLFAYAVPCFPQTQNAPKSAPAKAEALPTADEIAAKCAKGSGGKEAWAKLSTLVMKGTMEIPAANLTGTVEIYTKAPNKTLRIISLADGQFVQKEAFDGQVAWRSDPQTGLKRLEGAELEEVKTESAFDTDVRMKELYPDMKVTGRAKVGDRDAFTVFTREPGGRAVTLYFDAENGVRIAEDSEGPDENGKTQKISTFFEDYRTLGGVRVPYRVRGEAATFTFVIRIQEAQFNVPVENAMFTMPDATAPATKPQP